MIEKGTSGEVRRWALDIFGRVARAEAKLHGVPESDVAFHEVGAVDSIVDIVGAAACLAWLAPASVSAGVVAVGSGTVRSAHGRLPVPSPAALEILREVAAPITDGGTARELTTPTGAAILAAIVGEWRMPPMTALAVGYGAGDSELADRPNLVRLTVATRGGDRETLVEMAANVDDMNPELCEHVGERLFTAGALDVWWSPVVMKKGRPAVVLGVLMRPDVREACERVVLEETTTLGVRWHEVSRRALERRVDEVATEYGPVSVKVALDGSSVRNVAPEYASCRERAVAASVPLKQVYEAAIRAWHAR